MKEESYRIEYFLLNESFQRYVLTHAEEDVEYWKRWAKEHEAQTSMLNEAKEIITFITSRKIQPKHETISNEVFEKLQRQIFTERTANRKNRKIHSLHYWYAASILIIVGLAFLLKSKNHTRNNLSDRYLEVIVPVGQRSQLVLADGTRVWLNSGSTLKYPTEFLKEKREVFINGEAFFSVTHDKNLPFVVHMKENLSIKVFGTEFNVKCYADEKVIETTLINGKISLIKDDGKNHILQEINVKPNEKATYQKDNLQLVVTKLAPAPETNKPQPVKKIEETKPYNEIETITAWKDDALVFHDETFEEIGVKMERWFGLKITIADNDLKQERFTGKFVNKETIYQILDIFNRSEPIRYTTTKKEILITKKMKK